MPHMLLEEFITLRRRQLVVVAAAAATTTAAAVIPAPRTTGTILSLMMAEKHGSKLATLNTPDVGKNSGPAANS